jgi:phosphoribosylaminoimidazolecarboxamide formyltransferase/IMP cyclohydrolase
VLGGKELSYNNLLDLDSAFELAGEFKEPAAVIVKHNNPCGAGIGSGAAEAFLRALEGDRVSAYGGILAFNVGVDAAAAELVAAKENFFEAVIAPAFDPAALEILRTRPKWGRNLRVLEAGNGERTRGASSVRSLRNGLLVQTMDEAVQAGWKTATTEADEKAQADLRFAWTVCKHVKSNAIVIARDGRVVGVGAGQMSRLDSAELAVKKAGLSARGGVAASDAFFPFPDALERLLEAGVRAVAMPGGSIRDEEVIDAARARGVPLIITGMRHFRH